MSGEIVREQTVRAPMPPGWGVPPPAPSPARSPEADTVKTAPPAPPPAVPPVAVVPPEESLDLAMPTPPPRRASRPDRPVVRRRDDPPAVSGEVRVMPEPGAVAAPMPHAISDAIPVSLAASGPQPILPGVGMYGRPSTDPGMLAYSSREITGPQPQAQAEATGPHPVYGGARRPIDHQTNNVLWIVAGALVLMALALLGFVLTR